MTQIPLPTAEATIALGERLGRLLQAGDLVILTGGLGAGKTTFTKGIAAGLGVSGTVASPTFIIARTHPGPVPLVHVDAYRLGSLEEVDDLDLDSELSESVTVVEWGEGLVEDLAEARLQITIARPRGSQEHERYAEITAIGDRWDDVDFAALATADVD